MGKERVDELLVQRGLAPSRTRAQSLILAGVVYLGERRIEKPGIRIDTDAALRVREKDHPYVSRGGVKLAGALEQFAVSVSGLRCLDVGASTGGFTDCLLQAGACSVVSVDVGYGQLAQKLRADARVTVLERTNARTLKPDLFGGAVDLSVCDASFIGLAKLADALALCTRVGGHVLALIKPQFEAGRDEAHEGRGVIRDEGVRARALATGVDALSSVGFRPLGLRDCVLSGPKGNREAFVYAERMLSR